MLRSLLLVAAMLALSEGAVLLRFINTVPTRLSQDSIDSTQTGTIHPTNGNKIMDAVGLQYFAQTTGAVASPTLVWTQLLEQNDITTATAPYAWYFAMPPLRGYHLTKCTVAICTTATTAETAAIDKPLSPVHKVDNNGNQVDSSDLLEQTRLRADGVGLYLSFAAGTYQMQAYAAIAGVSPLATPTLADTATARPFQGSSASFTFVDGHVYTIVAYGVGQFGASTPLTGNTVLLSMIEESIAPTTFGMAALRWFHAISTSSSTTIDIYQGTGVSASNQIASAVPFGGVSAYVNVAPSENAQYPVAVTGSTANSLASSTAVTHDIRAGMRATIICAVNNDQNNQPFCRAIPSRAVVYVRLIHDAAGQDALVQGKAGAQKLSQTNLNLWASYEFPRPEQMVEQSQVIGNSLLTNHPATTDGFYPVVINVAPSTVSGYGEVFVPLFIMDYAVRFVITADADGFRTTLTTGAALAGFQNGQNTDFSAQTWFFFAPVFKRTNFVLKTDGMATLTGLAGTAGLPFPFVGTNQVSKGTGTFTGVATNTQDLKTFLTLDNYMEAGEYYSLVVSGVTNTGGQSSLEEGGIVSLFWRQDRQVDTVASGITSGNGILNLIPLGPSQAWTAGVFSIQLASSNTVPTTPSLSVVGVNRCVALVAGGRAVMDANVLPSPYTPTNVAEITLVAGSYTYSFSGGSGCFGTIPTTTTGITITAGAITDVFVLNSFGCSINSNDLSRLNVQIVTRQAATATGNSPFPTTSSRSAARHAVSLYSSAASNSASFLLVILAAALAALLAL